MAVILKHILKYVQCSKDLFCTYDTIQKFAFDGDTT